MRKELTEEAAISVPSFENKLQASSKESVDFEESNSEELSIPELDEISLDANEQEEFSDSDLSISEDLVEKIQPLMKLIRRNYLKMKMIFL